LYLSPNEERALSGEFGESLQIAYRVLLAVGRLTGAKRLIKITNAHLSGVSYLTIGEYGSEFLERFSLGAQVKVRTTVNPCGIDIQRLNEIEFIEQDYVAKQMKIVESYKRMGVVGDSFTCIPYELFHTPPSGSHVSWAESSAAIYGNSILGLKTNRESSLSALAAAVTGKTPYSGLHLEENRSPRFIVDVDPSLDLKGHLDFGLLGYFAGAKTLGDTIGLRGVKREMLQTEDAKALSAAIGTRGIAGMFTFVGAEAQSKEKETQTIEFTKKEYEETLAGLSINTEEEPEALVFGCPQLTIEGIRDLATLFVNRKIKNGMRCVVFTSRRVLSEAQRLGYSETLEASGAKIFADSCADFTPIVGKLGAETVATDSCKGAHYMRSVHNLKIKLEESTSIVQKYTQAK
jgi:predicted aconitase